MRKTYFPLFIFVILCGCSAQPVKIDLTALPSKDEKKSNYIEQQLGSTGYYFMVLNFKLVDDAAMINKLNRLAARIAHYTERPEINYKVSIIDSKYRNAFSFSDGYLVFTNSLLKSLESDEKIASVMAHEIAHITHKHVLQEYERITGNLNILDHLFGEKIFDTATALHYSQAYELQADQTGLRYLLRAGFNPNIMIATMEQTKQFEIDDKKMLDTDLALDPKLKRSMQQKLVKTHPETENRIANIISYLEEVKKTETIQYKPEDFNF